MNDAADHLPVIAPRHTRTLFRSSGLSRSNCSSLNQNSLNATLLQSQRMNYTGKALGILFLAPEPSSRAMVEALANTEPLGEREAARSR